MKTPKLLFLSLSAVLLCLIPACTTLNPDGTRTYDPVRSAVVTDSFTLVGRETVSRVIGNSSQEHGEEIAAYFRAIGTVFCRAKETRQLSPDSVLAELDRVTAAHQAKLDPLVITTKNVLYNLYKLFYDHRFTAQLSPEKWPAHVATVACDAIHGGLIDAGKPGVPAGP